MYIVKELIKVKKFAWLAAMFLLVGCTGDGNGDVATDTADTSSIETVETSSVEESVVDTATDSLPPEESSTEESRGTGTGGAGSDTGTAGESQDLTLYIPNALTESEGSQIYNDVIGVAETFTAENAALGDEGLFTISYTGYYIENEGGPLQGFFMGINRTGQPLTNLSFTLNFTVGGEPVWSNTVFTLHEEEFGTQPVNTAMPIFLDVPSGLEDLLMNAMPEETFIEIFDLQMN